MKQLLEVHLDQQGFNERVVVTDSSKSTFRRAQLVSTHGTRSWQFVRCESTNNDRDIRESIRESMENRGFLAGLLLVVWSNTIALLLSATYRRCTQCGHFDWIAKYLKYKDPMIRVSISGAMFLRGILSTVFYLYARNQHLSSYNNSQIRG
jgi:hypothetical protein